MTSTLVIQSHTNPLPFAWLDRCIDSVKKWSDAQQFNYQWLGDELFTYVEPSLLNKTADQAVVATDLARLVAIQKSLAQYERVIWIDADFLIFNPKDFVLPDQQSLPMGYSLGREVWVQHAEQDPTKLKAYVKVHNAFLLFDRGNSFLNFYIDHAKQFVREYDGVIPPQFVGPKLLTALHNVLQCPVLETAGMLSPLVMRDILSNGESNAALSLMKNRSKVPLAGANLCSSLTDKEGFSEPQMTELIDRLTSLGGGL